MAFGAPIGGRTTIGIDIEHHFIALASGASIQIGLRQLHFHLDTIGGSDRRQSHALRADHVTVAQHGGAKVEVAQVRERITVAHHQARHVALLVDVRQAELHKLVSRLHFFELRALFARTGQNTIAHEVALVRAGIVIARVQAADALFQFFGIVDALVDPVPDGTAHARIARLDGVPILAEVTDGVTHGVRILTNKDRFVHVVAVFLHPRDVGIHLRIEIREAFAAEGAMNARSFVVHGASGVHLLRQVVASAEVFAVAALVTQTPHHDRGVVVITRHHFANAIFESRNPALQI